MKAFYFEENFSNFYLFLWISIIELSAKHHFYYLLWRKIIVNRLVGNYCAVFHYCYVLTDLEKLVKSVRYEDYSNVFILSKISYYPEKLLCLSVAQRCGRLIEYEEPAFFYHGSCYKNHLFLRKRKIAYQIFYIHRNIEFFQNSLCSCMYFLPVDHLFLAHVVNCAVEHYVFCNA